MPMAEWLSSVTNMSLKIIEWTDPIKTQVHGLIDELFNAGITFELRHSFGYNAYEEEKTDDDRIEMILLKRRFVIGLEKPMFYMIHDHLGDECKRVIDRTDFKTFEELHDKIAELASE